MSYRIDPHSDIPPSRQLVEHVLDALARYEIPSGERLPSVRNMAADALVNPNTVVKAYKELENIGAVEGRNGSGVYVTARGPKIAKKLRGNDTLHDFKRAVRRAFDAGHGAVDLLRELGELLENNGKKESTAIKSKRRAR